MMHARRLAAAGAALAGLEVDALIVTDPTNIRYLTGFGGSNGAVVVRPDGATFLTDFRYTERAAPLAEFMDVREVARDVFRALCDDLAGVAPGARIGFEAASLTVQRHAHLVAAAPREPVPTTGVIERLRVVKDAGEQAAVRAATALIEPVFEAIAGEGLQGRTEREVAWRIEVLFHEHGADGLSFPPIVASHERGAQPHAEPSDSVIGPDTLVTIDLGCILAGYCSDCTRTFATGSLSDDLASAYALCLEAQEAAVGAVAPGITGAQADAVARDLIAAGGHSEHFGHPLGHGVGMEIHEDPRLSAQNHATLEPGMIVTVEPGIYLPGRGGVRIEDLVIVTDDGCERLTGYPKELRTLW